MTLHLGLIGVPTNSAGTTDGVARAPAALREAGLIDLLAQVCDLHDYGDVELVKPSPERSPASGVIGEEALAYMVGAVRAAVARARSEGRFPLVLGGDCPVLLGCLAAVVDGGRPGLLFLDGHEDAYPPELSPTGEAADMELGFLLGQGRLPERLSGLVPELAADQVVVLGARDGEILRAENVASIADRVKVVSDVALIEGDLEATTRAALARVLGGDRPSAWLHVDLDVLSTHALAAVDYRQPGGLGWEDLKTITEIAAGSGRLSGWDVTIYNPDRDNGEGASRINEYIAHVVCSLVAAHR